VASPSVPETSGSERVGTRVDVARQARIARWKAVAYSVFGAVSFLVAWQIASGFTRTEFDLLPGPLEVLQRMGEYTFGNEAERIASGWVFLNFWETFRKTLYGFAGALVLGVPIGILMGDTAMPRTSSSTSSTWPPMCH
jgi:ABC-type nitrate/sulfonate/bicarbonate transport system permease component